MLSRNQDAQASVLLVEDDEAIREALGDVLAEAGYEVRLAEHGGRALAVLAQGFMPHIILLDLMMPVMDGWHFLDHLEALPHYSHVPVVTVSAARATVPRRACRSLHKPVDIEAVLAAIERHRLPLTAGTRVAGQVTPLCQPPREPPAPAAQLGVVLK